MGLTIGLGTWDLRGEECQNVVRSALEIGYRHIDTAHAYDNHIAIGKAIKHFNRSELFITSKLAIKEQINKNNIELSVQQACEKALEELNTTYLDFYLIHFPDSGFTLETIFKIMTQLQSHQKVRKLGVSNFTIHHLQDLLKAGHIPYINQVEFHPYLYQKELLNYCRTHSIQVMSFRPFGKGRLLNEEPLFDKLGVKYNKTGAQVILRWLIQNNIAAVPKASSKKHLKENLEVFDFCLDFKDMLILNNLHQNKRYCRSNAAEYQY